MVSLGAPNGLKTSPSGSLTTLFHISTSVRYVTPTESLVLDAQHGYRLDVSVSGSQWHAGASPSLAHLIKQSALDVPHPTEPGKTLWDARNDDGPYLEGKVDAEFMAMYGTSQARRASNTEIPALGSGSDFTAFLQRLGVSFRLRDACEYISDC